MSTIPYVQAFDVLVKKLDPSHEHGLNHCVACGRDLHRGPNPSDVWYLCWAGMIPIGWPTKAPIACRRRFYDWFHQYTTQYEYTDTIRNPKIYICYVYVWLAEGAP